MRRSGFLVFLSLAVCQGAFADSPPNPEEQPVQVRGDNVEYFHEEQKVVGTGHVSIDRQDMRLTADKITYYTAAHTALAEGNVVLTQKGAVYEGERGEYDFKKKSGTVAGMEARFDPYCGKAERIEKLSDDHTRAVNSSLTTCCGDDRPFYRIQAGQVDVYPGKSVVARNALIFVAGVPVLFVPYLETHNVDIHRFPVQVVPGKNHEWGAFVLSKWRYHLVHNPLLDVDGNVLLDYRERNGVGSGFETFYRSQPLGRGAARFYFIDDQEARPDIENERYRMQWRHQMPLTRDTTLTTEIHKLSDAEVTKDFFFREEYERDAFPDNYLSVITAKPEYTLSILARERLNDFFTVVERSPEVRFDTRNRPFAGTLFYLREEYQFSNLKKAFASSDFDLDAQRVDTNHTLTYAGRVGDLSVAPHVGTRQTYYSRDLNDQQDLGRGIFDAGVDVSTKFYKTYDVTVHAWGLDWNQLRHIFTPSVSYAYRPNPTVSRTTLQQFDSLDALDKQNLMRFTFEQKLQTKQRAAGGELVSRDMARLVPFVDWDLHTRHLETAGVDLEWNPYTWMSIEADALYNARTYFFESANADLYLQPNDRFRFGLGQRYVRRDSSQTTAQVEWKVTDEWAVKVYERFEFKEDRSREFEVTVSRHLDCVILDFTYNHREGDTFYIAVRLAAFPKAGISLSQSYRRPKAPAGPLS